MDLRGRHFLRVTDLSAGELLGLLDLASRLKADRARGTETQHLSGRNIALVFEKTSTRTRCAFEVAAADQGAGTTYLGPTGTQIGHKESMKDTGRVLGRMYDAIAYRGFGQERVETLAAHSGVPVYNGLTDEYHPTQVLADLMTMSEQAEASLGDLSFCYLGDARNNMSRSLMAGASLLGMDARFAAPKACWPAPSLVQENAARAEEHGGALSFYEAVEEAVKGVDFLITDVWVSMGEPAEVWAERIEMLEPYRVDGRVVELTGNPSVKFMHCLPAFHDRETKIGEEVFATYGMDAMEVTDEVFESERSVVFDEAENRMHTAKALMVATLEG